SARRDLVERARDLARIGRANEARNLLTVVHEDQRRPEFHAKRAAKRTALAVLDLQVPQRGMRTHRLCQQRLRSAAVATPSRTELDERRAFERVKLSTRRCRIR